jgi:hypothetical protein
VTAGRIAVAVTAYDDAMLTDTAGRRPTWADLPPGARLFRLAHVAWGVVNLAALADVWQAALRGARCRRSWLGAALLLLEGAALVLGRGERPAGPGRGRAPPAGPLQRRLGDPVPMFELVLPPRAAKAAIPALTVVAAAGTGLLARRRATHRPAVRQRGMTEG